jgi:Ca-activated chloride channel family protein
MTFLSPERLWLFVGVAIFAGVYIFAQFRRPTYAVRFASTDLLSSVAPKRPAWRRHVPAVGFLVAMSLLVTAFAQPAQEDEVPRERATVILAIDISLSMSATDVQPSRFDAALEAAREFADTLPERFNLGLVTFDMGASVRVPPTRDHQSVVRALDNIEFGQGTSLGGAIVTSLEALELVVPDADETVPPASIILLSDGETSIPNPAHTDAEGIAAANEADVAVSTISFGTGNANIEIPDENGAIVVVPVPVNERALADISSATGGETFTASSLDELRTIYEDIGSAVGFEIDEIEVSWWFSGVALLFLALTGLFSLLWFSRLP